MEKVIKAELILENGMRFKGKAFGYMKEAVGEVIFNTAMTGYQELLTDPSHAGQIVCMTYPLIGNCGINLEDMVSEGPKLNGFVVREKCDYPSNWRCEIDLDGYLKQNKIIGIEGIDTRAITMAIREYGTMRGIITTRANDLTESQIRLKFDALNNKNVVKECTTKEKYEIEGQGKHIAFIDLGSKKSIIDSFVKKGCRLTVFPAYTSAEEILAVNPDGVFISDGPGSPKDVPEIVENIKKLIGKKPLVSETMGSELITLALGGETEKMKFGHHGGNQPVKDIENGRVYITSQNHEYTISKLPEDVVATFINVNDNTIEGIKHTKLPIYGVQFNPSVSMGPEGSVDILDKFLEVMGRGEENA